MKKALPVGSAFFTPSYYTFDTLPPGAALSVSFAASSPGGGAK